MAPVITAEPAPVDVVRRRIEALLQAGSEQVALSQLRELWVGILDFNSATGVQNVELDGALVRAEIIGRRDGVPVLVVRVPREGHVRTSDVKELARQLKGRIGDQMLLCVGSADGDEWQFVWPSFTGGRDLLRRMGAQRGHPARTLWEQLATIDRAATSSR
jgi:hypothetical protein